MSYTREDLNVSSGIIEASTKRYNSEKEHYVALGDSTQGDPNKLYYDTKGNKEYSGSAITTDTVPQETTHFYGTTITNTGKAAAYVNLYLSDLTNNTNNYIGTYQPSLTHKTISSSVHLANYGQTRVYVQWSGANNWSKSGAKHYLVYTTKTGDTSFLWIDDTDNKEEEEYMIDNDYDTQNILSGKETFFVDLPVGTTKFYFAVDDGEGNWFNTTTLKPALAWYTTKTITNINAETGYYLTGVADDTTGNAQYSTFKIKGGISVKTYFDTAMINKNQHAYVTLNKDTNYTGVSASYQVAAYVDEENNSNNIAVNNNITVNANTGFVTANNSLTQGINIAYIETTITGSLGDTKKVGTFISNPSSVAATPVALNVKIPAGKFEDEEDEDFCTEPGKAEVVWYIQNASSGSVNFTNIYYTK